MYQFYELGVKYEIARKINANLHAFLTEDLIALLVSSPFVCYQKKLLNDRRRYFKNMWLEVTSPSLCVVLFSRNMEFYLFDFRAFTVLKRK
jgi:hypothetical protein